MATKSAKKEEMLGKALDRLVHLWPKYEKLKTEVSDLQSIIKEDAAGQSTEYTAPGGGKVVVSYGKPGKSLDKKKVALKFGAEAIQDCYTKSSPKSSFDVEEPAKSG